MTINEIERRLPVWGLHDACLIGLAHDYRKREATLELRVFIDQDQTTWRPCRLTLTGVAFVAIDPPVALSLHAGPGVWIDAGSGVGKGCEERIPEVPEGTFVEWLYIGETRAFIHVAARDAAFEWTGPEESVPKELRGLELPAREPQS